MGVNTLQKTRSKCCCEPVYRPWYSECIGGVYAIHFPPFENLPERIVLFPSYSDLTDNGHQTYMWEPILSSYPILSVYKGASYQGKGGDIHIFNYGENGNDGEQIFTALFFNRYGYWYNNSEYSYIFKTKHPESITVRTYKEYTQIKYIDFNNQEQTINIQDVLQVNDFPEPDPIPVSYTITNNNDGTSTLFWDDESLQTFSTSAFISPVHNYDNTVILGNFVCVYENGVATLYYKNQIIKTESHSEELVGVRESVGDYCIFGWDSNNFPTMHNTDRIVGRQVYHQNELFSGDVAEPIGNAHGFQDLRICNEYFVTFGDVSYESNLVGLPNNPHYYYFTVLQSIFVYFNGTLYNSYSPYLRNEGSTGCCSVYPLTDSYGNSNIDLRQRNPAIMISDGSGCVSADGIHTTCNFFPYANILWIDQRFNPDDYSEIRVRDKDFRQFQPSLVNNEKFEGTFYEDQKFYEIRCCNKYFSAEYEVDYWQWQEFHPLPPDDGDYETWFNVSLGRLKGVWTYDAQADYGDINGGWYFLPITNRIR